MIIRYSTTSPLVAHTVAPQRVAPQTSHDDPSFSSLIPSEYSRPDANFFREISDSSLSVHQTDARLARSKVQSQIMQALSSFFSGYSKKVADLKGIDWYRSMDANSMLHVQVDLFFVNNVTQIVSKATGILLEDFKRLQQGG